MQDTTQGNEVISENRQPRSLKLATSGIRTGHDFATMMSALMSDVIEGTITPSVANAAVNAGGKLLKVVDMQLRFGTTLANGGRTLSLCGSDLVPDQPAAIAGTPEERIRAIYADARSKIDAEERQMLATANGVKA